MSDTSVEQKPVQEMKKAPAKGTVTAVISLAGQREDFVSQGVDFGTTEQNAWLYAYKGQADDADVYIDFDLQLQAGVRDVVIGGGEPGACSQARHNLWRLCEIRTYPETRDDRHKHQG